MAKAYTFLLLGLRNEMFLLLLTVYLMDQLFDKMQ